MTIVIANNLPVAIRGCLKTWFIEPKSNVFVAEINNALAERIASFLHRETRRSDSGLLLIQSTNSGLGFKILQFGKPDKIPVNISGLDLF